MSDFKYFSAAVNEAIHEIEFVDYELGRIGREAGKKPIRKKALLKIIEIIKLYNAEEYDLIASIDLYSPTVKAVAAEVEKKLIAACYKIHGQVGCFQLYGDVFVSELTKIDKILNVDPNIGTAILDFLNEKSEFLEFEKSHDGLFFSVILKH